MSFVRIILSVFLISAANASEAKISHPNLCTDIPACVQRGQFALIGEPKEQSDAFFTDILAAEKKFIALFGTAPLPGYLMLDGAAASITKEQHKLLKSRGAAWKLPWKDFTATAADTGAGKNAALETQIRAQLGERANGPEGEALVQAALAQAAAKLREQNKPLAKDDYQTVLHHELGHMWFIAKYWPNRDTTQESHQNKVAQHYGGPAPDWLDELAAIAMENMQSSEKRRGQFASTLKDDSVKSEMADLNKLFTSVHPGIANGTALKKAVEDAQANEMAKGNPGIYKVSLPAGTLKAELNFYSQLAELHAFLSQELGNGYLASLSEHIRAGGDAETWFSKQRQSESLNKRWQAHLATLTAQPI